MLNNREINKIAYLFNDSMLYINTMKNFVQIYSEWEKYTQYNIKMKVRY